MDWKKAGRAYLLDLMVRMAHHSTAIEGNTLTLGDTRTILIHGIVPKTTKLRELWEVLNYKELVPYLTEHASEAISLAMIQDVDGILMQHIDRRGGHFKEAENMIIGASFIPTHPSQVPQALTQWCDNLSYRRSTRRPMRRKWKPSWTSTSASNASILLRTAMGGRGARS